jgi:hypothetical protein
MKKSKNSRDTVPLYLGLTTFARPYFLRPAVCGIRAWGLELAVDRETAYLLHFVSLKEQSHQILSFRKFVVCIVGDAFKTPFKTLFMVNQRKFTSFLPF